MRTRLVTRLIIFSKSSVFPLIIIEIFLFILYLKTMSPGYNWMHEGWDAGDLLANIKIMGIAHPPGMPLYLLVGKIFSLLPFSDFAFRLNFMSTILLLAGLALFYFTAYRITPNRLAAGLATLFLGTAIHLWQQALITEVNTFTFFFGMLLTYLLFSFRKLSEALSDQPLILKKALFKRLLIIIFFFSLSLSNHYLTMLLLPGMLTYLFLTLRGAKMTLIMLTPAKIALYIFMIVLGLLPFAYLPLRARENPALNWGNPSNLTNFVDHITAKTYHAQFTDNRGDIFDGMATGWILIENNLTMAGIFLGIIGLYYLVSIKLYKEMFYIVFGFMVYGYFINHYVDRIAGSYSLILIGIFTLSVSSGISLLLSRMKKALFINIFVLTTIIFIGYRIWEIYPIVDLSQMRTAQKYAEESIRDVKQNAIILASSDHLMFALYYSRYVLYENRKDIRLLAAGLYSGREIFEESRKQNPDLVFPISDFSSEEAVMVKGLEAFIRANYDNKPIYMTLDYPPPQPGADDEKELGNLLLKQEGVLYRVFLNK